MTINMKIPRVSELTEVVPVVKVISPKGKCRWGAYIYSTSLRGTYEVCRGYQV